MKIVFSIYLLAGLAACANTTANQPVGSIPKADFVINDTQTHNKFSSKIPAVIEVPAGSVIEAFTHEATGGQLSINSTAEDFNNVDLDKVHTLTGPVYVTGAEVGDILAVELIELEPGEWGWTGMSPHFGFLAEENKTTDIKTFKLDHKNNMVHFKKGISIPMRPFAGVMGVAPDTEEMLSTFPPRANGGNMDDPNIQVGSTVYFPVLVKGALFSIGDTHAVQGMGEVVGTAVEAPMRVKYRVRLIQGRSIKEPQYETAEYYATTGFASTIDEAAKKATRYMIEHLVETRGLTWEEAYMLCSLAGDLHIVETVDHPHMLVAMHVAKNIFTED